jgi:hypothetical protein
LVLTFDVRNVGRVAAYKWTSLIEQLQYFDDRQQDYIFGAAPGAPARSGGVRIDDTILPGCSLEQKHILTLRLRPSPRSAVAMESDARSLLSEAAVYLRLATETSPGEQVRFELGPLANYGQIVQRLTDFIQG